jgi:hypothetical protein
MIGFVQTHKNQQRLIIMNILKIVKAERGLSNPYSGSGDPELVLIIYDTDGVEKIHTRADMRWTAANLPDNVIEVKAKYAICLTHPDDSDMIAQCYATRQYASEAEWTDDWHDLPNAIERLRARHPDGPFPDEIAYVIDWPYRDNRPRLQTEKAEQSA